MRTPLRTLATLLVVAACGKGGGEPADQQIHEAPPAAAPADAPLRVGVTLHPYYSWTRNVVRGVPGVAVVAVLPGEVDAGSYQPAAADIARLADLDAIVVNGIGHDDFIRDMIAASGNARIVVIEANAGTPLLRSQHGDAPNSHTFISFTNAIQQSGLVARRLGELRPAHAEAFARNAAAYADRLRGLRAAAAEKLAGARVKRVVSVHDGYSYLLQEFGIELAGVVEPAHGLVPSASELAAMIDLVRKEKITVVLSEESFPDKLLATLSEATRASVYLVSHVATGEYTDEKFEQEMTANADILVKALVTDPAAAAPATP